LSFKKNTLAKLSSFLTFLLVFLLPTQLGWHFWPQFSFVSGLRIDYYSPTIYLTDILLILLLFFKPFKLLKFIKLKAFWLFIFLFSLYSIKLPHPWIHLYGLVRILEIFLLFWIIKNLKNLKPIFWGLVGAVSYTTILATTQFLSQRAISGKWYFLGERWFTSETPGIAQVQIFGKLLLRPYATFSHPNSMAGFLLVSLWLIIWLGLLLCDPDKNQKKNVAMPFMASSIYGAINRTATSLGNKLGLQKPPRFNLIKKVFSLPITYYLLPITSLGLLLSFSHTAWLVFLISILIYIFKSLPITYYLLPITLITSLTFPIILLTASRLFPPLAFQEEVYLRNFLAQKGIEAFLQKPLFGQGINHFIHFLGSSRPGLLSRTFYQPTHNIWWLILAESGLIGLFFALWITHKTIKRASAKVRLPSDEGSTPVVRQAGGVLKTQITNLYHKPLSLSLVSILLLSATDHYLLTLQQNRLLLGLFLGLVWRKKQFFPSSFSKIIKVRYKSELN